MAEDMSFEGFVEFLMRIDPERTLRTLGYSDEEIERMMKEMEE